jgi:hypothetical protein
MDEGEGGGGPWPQSSWAARTVYLPGSGQDRDDEPAGDAGMLENRARPVEAGHLFVRIGGVERAWKKLRFRGYVKPNTYGRSFNEMRIFFRQRYKVRIRTLCQIFPVF